VPGRAEAFAAAHGIARATTDPDELIAACDAVSVVTPDRFHAQPSLAVLKAGRHLLCEKPLTVTLAEARRVLAAADAAARRGVIGMVNFSYRRSAAFQEAIRLRAAGRLGRLRHLQALYHQSWLAQDEWGHWTSEGMAWRLQTAAGSGGVLGDLGCHILDLATAIAGPVRAVRCALRTFPKFADGRFRTAWRGKALDANDSAVIELDFSDGCLGVVQTSRWALGNRNHLRCELSGHAGALRLDLDESYERIHTCLGRDVRACAWKARDLKPAPDVWRRWIAAIRRGRADQPDIARGAGIQAMLDACQRSAVNGRWVAVPAIR
jgi:predicted dehydrogenase